MNKRILEVLLAGAMVMGVDDDTVADDATGVPVTNVTVESID